MKNWIWKIFYLQEKLPMEQRLFIRFFFAARSGFKFLTVDVKIVSTHSKPEQAWPTRPYKHSYWPIELSLIFQTHEYKYKNILSHKKE